MSYCCVPTCSSYQRRECDRNLSFHRFPSHPHTRQTWITKIRRDVGPHFQITDNTRVCSKHFTKDCLFKSLTRLNKLKRGSVPSLFTWCQHKSRRTIQRIQSSNQVLEALHDHDYVLLQQGKRQQGPREKSSDKLSSEMEANNSCNGVDKATDDSNGVPSMAPARAQCEAPFTCSSCGKKYKFKARYNGHLRKSCGKAVGVSSSKPVPTSSQVKIKVKEEVHDGEDLDHHSDLSPVPNVDKAVQGSGVPFCAQTLKEEAARRDHRGPEGGRKVQSWVVESVLGDQVVCRTSDSRTSAEHQQPRSDYLSMIQITDVVSLVTSQDDVPPTTEEVGTSAGKGKEPGGGSPSSDSLGKGSAPRNEERGTSKLMRRNSDKLSDKLIWRSWVERCRRNRRRAIKKWPNTGGRRALLCGKRFDQNMRVDQHALSALRRRFHYRCGSCSMSFKAWASLGRHLLQAHSVRIQRSSKTSPVAEANKCILNAKNKDIVEAFINDVKDDSTDIQSHGRLTNEEHRPNSERRSITIDGSPHQKSCLFAIEDIKKGEEIVFDNNGVDLPGSTSTQKKEVPAAGRTAAAAKISAIEEAHMAEIASLQAALQKQLAELRAENQKLAEELGAARTPPAPATPPCHETSPVKSTPTPTFTKCSQSSWIKRQHPDMDIPVLAPERERKISQLSEGRPDRYGSYLFQAVVGTKKYHSWCCNTNWSGSAGKWELPRNLQEYLLLTLAEKFSGFGHRETRMVIERINELLRKPRQIFCI